MSRIYMSPPDVGQRERDLLLQAFDSGWIAPLGEHVDAFEREVAAVAGRGHAAALSSGTAGLHLALRLLGVGAGDEVLVSDLTFVATANAVTYVGARPTFVDADISTWQMDPALLAEALETRRRAGRLPAAVVVADVFGQCADYDRLEAICGEHGVPLIEDAAESLGATYRGRPAGSFGAVAVFSFNGNKIITTSGGGMLVTDDGDFAQQARFLATQAREPGVHYEHVTTGYNYRLSNLLAALGRGQLEGLSDKVATRRATNATYRGAFRDLPGIDFMPNAPYGEPTNWLTCLTVDPDSAGVTRDQLLQVLQDQDIEARPVWKPMHAQPVFSGCDHVGGAVSTLLFDRGVCLPSGSSLSDDDVARVVDAVRGAWPRRERRDALSAAGAAESI